MATVTVITPYKDAEKFIPAFVAMLKAQTYSDWICLLVDDGSTDHGPSLLADLATGDPRLVPLKRPGRKSGSGPAEARNFALSSAVSPYIAFCDIDDLWHPEKLAMQINFHISNCLDISVTGYGRFTDGYAPTISSWRCPPKSLSYLKLLTANRIPMLAAVVNRSLLHSSFPISPHEDFCFWLSLFRFYPRIRYGSLPYALAFYRLHGANLSNKKWKMLIWVNHVYRQHGIHPAIRPILLVLWSLIQLGNLVRRVPAYIQRPNYLSSLLQQSPLYLRPNLLP